MIVFSLLATGAVVVFTNRVEDYRSESQALRNQLTNTQRERNITQDQVNSGNNLAAAQVSMLNNKLQDLTKDLAASKAESAGKSALLNQQAIDKTVLEAQNATLVDSLKTSAAELTALHKQHDDLSKEFSTTATRNSELASANVDLEKRYQQADREREHLLEQLVQAKSEIDRMRPLVGPAALPNGMAAAGQAPADLKGVIKDVRSDPAGVTYATITLGASDKVSKNNTFLVVNPSTSTFLATLTVITVDATESFGRLDGPPPGVKSVKKGDLVTVKP